MKERMSQRDRMLAGELYRADDPQLAADSRRARRLIQRINNADPGAEESLQALFAELLGGFGARAVIRPPFYCDYGYPTVIGPGTFINFGATVLDCAPVHIGADVQIGPHVQLLTATHPIDPDQRRAGLEYALPITIEDGAWLGGAVIVCPGVRIGTESVIGAGSVVTRDVPARAVAVGSPCRVVHTIPAADQRP